VCAAEARGPHPQAPRRRNGLGDTHERLNFILRVGRALGRAAFLWADSEADPSGPPRARHVNAERVVRPYTRGMFDPGAYVNGFGGVKWRWSASRREAAEARHPGAAWLFLHYECMRYGDGGCTHSQVRFGDNASVALDADTKDARETAQRVFAFLNEHFRHHPLLRLQTSLQGDLTPESRLPDVCPRGFNAAPPPHCDQYCESFFNWRPNRKTWVALRPHLAKMDGWKATVGLTVRTGTADHYGALPEVLQRSLLAGANGSAAAIAARLETLFAPCPPGTVPFRRDKQVGERACVNWNSDEPAAPPPSLQLAARCGGRHGGAEDSPPLYGESGGPLGAFIDCGARAAQALAAASGGDEEARAAWGVMLFSDAPAVKCLLEGSELARQGHAHVTPTAPGHVQYAPDGPVLHAVGRMTLVDWYLIGLLDWQLVVLGSAFGGSTNVRRKTSPRQPEGSGLSAMHRGFERWFEAGRENFLGRGVDVATLETLSSTSHICPVTQFSNTKIFELYEQAGDRRYEG